MVAIIFRYFSFLFAENEGLVLTDQYMRCRCLLKRFNLRLGFHDVAIEGSDAFDRATRHVEHDVGHTEHGGTELRARLVAAELVTPGACNVYKALSRSEIELCALQVLAHGFETFAERFEVRYY